MNGLNLYCYCNNNSIMYSDETGNFGLLFSICVGAAVGFLTSYIPDVIKKTKDGFELSDLNTFKDNGLKYIGAALGGAIGGLGAGIGTTILASGIGSVVEGVFSGEITSMQDAVVQFAIGGVLGGVGYGVSKIISVGFASKKISGIIGTVTDNSKINKNLSKAGYNNLKIGRDGMKKISKELYKNLGYENLKDLISTGFDLGSGFLFKMR